MEFSDKEETLISIFLNTARPQNDDTAIHFLQASNWDLEEALHCYLSGDYDDQAILLSDRGSRLGHISPEKRNSLPYIVQEPTRVWETELGATTSTAESSRQDNLASLYRPPFHLLFDGSFYKAKSAASMQDKWLLVNIQSTREFSSHMLNRDTWANDAVSQIISTNFIFWQVFDDTYEGHDVCADYRLDSIPAVLVIDPITGKKMCSWDGMVEPQSLLEGLLTFLDAGPTDHHNTLSHKLPRRNSSPSKSTDSDASEVGDEEVQRALEASFKSVKESSEIAGGDNKYENVASNLQETTVMEFEKLVI
ncbi:putative UBX domain-containing protein 2/7 [Medicago truncatula]|uniref:Putative UBX domain-containing protein 2/7 n=1 Tax=Medicago truncatula TaxID=3880 RepID=A0A396I635_MEDTR|nr:plant UBX domain-containing protein 7 isoform X1 [Medicago truncatula]RHN58297.1 putative UBX domain-containing protein 2/7 [Medicago truncatula]